MIKRRFYRRGGGSDSSSSSSDSDSDAIPDVDEEDELEQDLQEVDREKKEADDDDDDDEEERKDGGTEGKVKGDKSNKTKKNERRKKRNRHSPSPGTGSGYESEDSSLNEIRVDSSGLLTSEEENIVRDGPKVNTELVKKASAPKTEERDSKAENRKLNLDNSIQADFSDYVLQCKSVFKCRLCPRIVCLSEETIKAHLSSKRHGRSKKLLGEGRLKLMLNSDGDIEEDVETHAERHNRIIALAQEPVVQAKKDSGRQRQSRRRKKKQSGSSKLKSEELGKKPHKKRRKNQV